MSPLSSSSLARNRLLARLPEDERTRLLPLLELAPLSTRQDPYAVDAPLHHVYFPISGASCVLLVMNDGSTVEVATIGHEGMMGIGAFFGLQSVTYRVSCLIPGEALRLTTAAFAEALRHLPQFETTVRRYAAARFRISMQSGACNALHPAERRVCRWLLMLHDRAGTGGLPLTQEALAEMLGVRRQTVSVIAAQLQSAGAIRYRRGLIRILNRTALETGSCECYEMMRTVYERTVLGTTL